MTHDTGRRLGCFQAGIATPYLDGLAADGVCFTRYHSVATQCSSSRGTMLTGRFPHRHGLMGLARIGWRLHPAEWCLARYLAEAGYETHLVGLQHEGPDTVRLGYRHVLEGRCDARSVGAAVGHFLRSRTRHCARPFFVMAGMRETHRPFDRPEYLPDDPSWVPVPAYLPDTPAIRHEFAAFGGLVRAADTAVGTMLEALKASGLAENTLVVYTTDHGIAFPRAKGMSYDAGLETALIMRWPGRIPVGLQRNELLSNVDLLPTLLEVAGIPAPEDLDGQSFLPLVTGEYGIPREYIFFEMTWHDRYNPMRGIRTDHHKYILNFDPQSPLVFLPADIYRSPSGVATRERYHAESRPAEELYDLDADPLELVNLATDPAYAGLCVEFRDRLDRWMSSTKDPLLRGPVAPPRAQAERLLAEAAAGRLTGPLTDQEQLLIIAAMR